MNVMDIARHVKFILKKTTSIIIIIQNEHFLNDGIQFSNVMFAIISFDIIYIYLKLGHLTTFRKFFNQILMPFAIYNPLAMRTWNIWCILFFSKVMIIKNWIIILGVVIKEHIGFLFKVFISFKIFILFKHISNISSIFVLSFYYLKNK